MKTIVFSTLIFVVVTFYCQLWPEVVQAQTAQPSPQTQSDGSLSEARQQLEQAFSSFRDDDMEATRKHLLEAKTLLDQSSLNSASETVKLEAKKLVNEIESFQLKLAEGGAEKENSIARFWRRATSFIRREAEQLVNQYVELSQNEKTFKHLLDAKMHLFIAEHDLFVSHDARDAYAELDKVLADLSLARQQAVKDVLPEVQKLTDQVNSLQQKMSAASKSWLDNEVLSHLKKATEELLMAEQTAKPDTSLQIGDIRQQVDELRKEVETINLRNDYDEIMKRLKMIIDKLESE